MCSFDDSLKFLWEVLLKLSWRMSLFWTKIMILHFGSGCHTAVLSAGSGSQSLLTMSDSNLVACLVDNHFGRSNLWCVLQHSQTGSWGDCSWWWKLGALPSGYGRDCFNPPMRALASVWWFGTEWLGTWPNRRLSKEETSRLTLWMRKLPTNFAWS